MIHGAAIGLTVLGLARSGPAAPRVPTRLVWDGSVCGTKENFAARVAQRTHVVHFVNRGQRVSVRLHIERRGDGLDARASIEARGQAPIVRHIESPDCEDALDALALVVAIGIEARSAATPRRRPSRSAPAAPESAEASAPVEPPPAEPPAPEPPAVPDSGEPAPEVAPSLPPAGAEPAPSSATRAESVPEPPSRAAEASEPPRPPASPVRAGPEPAASSDSEAAHDAAGALDVGAGVLASTSIGVAPDALIGGALWIAVGWAREGAWSPELLLGAAHQRVDGVVRASGEADFALSVASLSLCPLRWGSAAFFLRPCAAGSIGRLAAEGHDTFDARSVSRPWQALGGTLDGVAKAGIVEFRAVFAATAPLSRDRFSFEGACSNALCEADVFHHVAPVIWSGALGAGIRVW